MGVLCFNNYYDYYKLSIVSISLVGNQQVQVQQQQQQQQQIQTQHVQSSQLESQESLVHSQLADESDQISHSSRKQKIKQVRFNRTYMYFKGI